MKTPPKIESVRLTPDHFFATINGKEYRLDTHRPILWQNGKIYLPDDLVDQAETQWIFDDPGDEDSQMNEVKGCIHSPGAAKIMAAWAAGEMKSGVHRIE